MILLCTPERPSTSGLTAPIKMMITVIITVIIIVIIPDFSVVFCSVLFCSLLFCSVGRVKFFENSRILYYIQHNLRIAAVVNEYGSVDHDGEVVERDGLTDSVEKLPGGCVCCEGSLWQQLEEKVRDMLRMPDHADNR